MQPASVAARSPVILLCGIFFFSGASALIFETLWFHQAGLVFGNDIWATSMVLSSFMGGLAIGNGLAGKWGHRVANGVRFYALVEALIGITGFLLTLVLPAQIRILSPLFRPFMDQPIALNVIRLCAAFLMMLVPTTAMGATLPILVKAATRWEPRFGQVLGRLYGWNTLGAVAGTLSVEMLLISLFGIRGTALGASLLNLGAAGAALWLSPRGARNAGRESPPAAPASVAVLSTRAWRVLLAAAISGGVLLALEVVWFRFMALFIANTGLAFALMLAVILTGIGLGGLISSSCLRRWPDAHRFVGHVALAAGIASILVYMTFSPKSEGDSLLSWRFAVWGSVKLMFPVSLLSGALFTFMGEHAKEALALETTAAGFLTLFNTLGAMLGSFLAGFVLLPALGMEKSFFLLALAYGMVVLCVPKPKLRLKAPFGYLFYIGAAVFALLLLFFPFGLMKRVYLRAPVERVTHVEGSKFVASREGLTETIQYVRQDWEKKPLYYRLITNSFSMSASMTKARRYMKLYTYLPVALHPNPKHVLQICYGVGSTAKSLTDTKAFETIDIVDTSRDVMEMSDIVFPRPEDRPLKDSRVKVHVEDGRFFLQTTDRKFDLITSEPPPPRVATTVNLYTSEYFQLIHDRLAPGGYVTYWLPVHQLLISDTQVIIRSFCDVFSDCTLWTGAAYDWMLVGTRGATTKVSEQHFRRQWDDPVVRAELQTLGFEEPESLGATFMGDRASLGDRIEGVLPLTDNYPKRLVLLFGELPLERRKVFTEWMNPYHARQAFEQSEFIRRVWPDSLVRKTLPLFDVQGSINERLGGAPQVQTLDQMSTLNRVLTETSFTTVPLWILGSTVEQQQIIQTLDASAARRPRILFHLGANALAHRRYEEADRLWHAYEAALPQSTEEAVNKLEEAMRLKTSPKLRLFALCRAGRAVESQALAGQIMEAERRSRPDASSEGFWRLIKQICHLKLGD